MPCHWCASRDRIPNVPEHGNCYECQFATCAHPSGRADKYFHGEQCACECRKFVCELDVGLHAKVRHGKDDPSPCFPALSASASIETFGGAANALATGRTEDRIDPKTVAALNRWLNFYRPGRAALVRALGPDWRQREGHVVELESRPGDLFVEFRPSFYSVGTLQRVLALSGQSMSRYAASRRPGRAILWIPEHSRDAFRNWSLVGELPDEHALAEWLPPGTPSSDVQAILAALAVTTPPERAEDLVRWVVEEVQRSLETA